MFTHTHQNWYKKGDEKADGQMKGQTDKHTDYYLANVAYFAQIILSLAIKKLD